MHAQVDETAWRECCTPHFDRVHAVEALAMNSDLTFVVREKGGAAIRITVDPIVSSGKELHIAPRPYAGHSVGYCGYYASQRHPAPPEISDRFAQSFLRRDRSSCLRLLGMMVVGGLNIGNVFGLFNWSRLLTQASRPPTVRNLLAELAVAIWVPSNAELPRTKNLEKGQKS